jgi:predicted ATPase
VNSRERRAFLAQATSNLGEAIPLLAALLSIPSGERYPTLDVTPQKRKEKTLKALLAQVGGLAAQHAVLMVVEDVQWIDPASLELFDLIVDRVPSLPALLIITFRQEFMRAISAVDYLVGDLLGQCSAASLAYNHLGRSLLRS